VAAASATGKLTADFVGGLIMHDKEESARTLADIHYRVEEGMQEIYRLVGKPRDEKRPEEPIKLLEVNEGTIPTGILPLQFGPLPERGIFFPSVIVEITPEEFQQIQMKQLKLPHDWKIGELLPRRGQSNGK
jgi:hypothetical protein